MIDNTSKPSAISTLVVTPIFMENSMLIKRNVDSVKNQINLKKNPSHVLIQDGVSNLQITARSALNYGRDWYQCRYNHDDYGDYVRKLGSRMACLRGVDALSYLDADNYWAENHLQSVLETHLRYKKNIIVSGRRHLDENGDFVEVKEGNFFDTNTITLFGDCKRIGSLWGNYPKELSLIGDRIISRYIQDNFADQIATTNQTTVIYSYSKIPKERVFQFKAWYKENYESISPTFRKQFGFDLIV